MRFPCSTLLLFKTLRKSLLGRGDAAKSQRHEWIATGALGEGALVQGLGLAGPNRRKGRRGA